MFSVVMSSGIPSRTILGFLRFWMLTSSSAPHVSSILFPRASIYCLLLASIMSLPSISILSEVIPTFISAGFTFDFSWFIIICGVWFIFDLTIALCRQWQLLRLHRVSYCCREVAAPVYYQVLGVPAVGRKVSLYVS